MQTSHIDLLCYEYSCENQIEEASWHTKRSNTVFPLLTSLSKLTPTKIGTFCFCVKSKIRLTGNPSRMFLLEHYEPGKFKAREKAYPPLLLLRNSGLIPRCLRRGRSFFLKKLELISAVNLFRLWSPPYLALICNRRFYPRQWCCPRFINVLRLRFFLSLKEFSKSEKIKFFCFGLNSIR